MGRRVVAVVLAAALFGTACSSDAEPETADDTEAPGSAAPNGSGDGPVLLAEASPYCQASARVGSLEVIFDPAEVNPLEPDELRAAFEAYRDRLDDLGAAVPDEIAADQETLRAAVDEIFATFEEVGYDFRQLVGRADNVLAPLDSDEVTQAQERVANYDRNNCPAELLEQAVAEEEVDERELLDLIELIQDTFSDAEVEEALAFTEVADVEALARGILAGDIDLQELDEQLSRRRAGVPLVFGDDPELDILYNACGDGDFEACDGLYSGAPVRSVYERYAASCGGRADPPVGGQCVADFG